MMEALMSRIMSSAQQVATQEDKPLDLAWRRYTRHTCDRLITLEDLRTQHDSSCTTEEDDSTDVKDPRWTAHITPETSSPESDLETAKSEPHPFSIAALIGDTDSDTSSDLSVPASVSSPYMDNVMQYQSFLRGLYTSPNSDGSGSDLSPVRGVSMFNTKDVYWCHVCSATCEDQNEADRHQYTHRVQGATCNTRRSIIQEHGYVTRHELLDQERMKCGLCHKVVTACFFHKHQRLHDGHVCQMCGQEFATNSRLQDHMNIHTGRTPFACTVCDRKFAKRSSLTQHQRYHRDHKSFMCRFCHKYFNSKYACAVHERLHTGENPFKCQFPGCTRAFPQKIQLKLHITSNHRGRDY